MGFFTIAVMILAVLCFLIVEHAVLFICLFVPLVVIAVLCFIKWCNSPGAKFRYLFWMFIALAAAVVVVMVASVPKSKNCAHEDTSKIFSFQFAGSTADSRIKTVCNECDDELGTGRFSGTPTDTSYLEAIRVNSDADEIVYGEQYTMTAILTLGDYSFDKTRVNCKVEHEDVIVYFSVEFLPELEEKVSALQEGDEITFRGRFYDSGCGFTECELIEK